MLEQAAHQAVEPTGRRGRPEQSGHNKAEEVEEVIQTRRLD